MSQQDPLDCGNCECDCQQKQLRIKQADACVALVLGQLLSKPFGKGNLRSDLPERLSGRRCGTRETRNECSRTRESLCCGLPGPVTRIAAPRKTRLGCALGRDRNNPHRKSRRRTEPPVLSFYPSSWPIFTSSGTLPILIFAEVAVHRNVSRPWRRSTCLAAWTPKI